MSLPSLLITLRTLLGEPNGADGLVPEVTKQFGVDYEGWWREAEGVTRREATEEKLRVMEDGVAAVVVEDGGGKGVEDGGVAVGITVEVVGGKRSLEEKDGGDRVGKEEKEEDRSVKQRTT